MRHSLIIFLGLAAMFCLAATCGKTEGNTGNSYKGLKRIAFAESDDVFPNPERGFYNPYSYHQASSSTISETQLTAARALGRTLVYIGYYLTDYMESDIDEAYLDMIDRNFEVLRKTGFKCVLRFAYKDGYDESDHPWDASVDQALSHISQLKPVLQRNADVIFCMQAGFVGAWGEWYYTDNFVFNPSSDEDFVPRRKLVEALLDALPASRQICLRTPAFKKRILGITNADTLTASTAFSGTAQARLAGHNDCFLANTQDYGTFENNLDREFWCSDTKYTIMGGETCNPSVYSECENSLDDMEAQHWTYLNSAYHQSVISGWRTGGCYDEINLRLGYRLVLDNVYVTKNPASGSMFKVALELENKGFAAPANPRGVEIVLVSAGGDKTVYAVDTEPRLWLPGKIHTVEAEFVLPSEAGEYTLYLNLPDPEAALKDNPMFSIRLANEGLWEEETGYNRLATIIIE